MCPWWEVTIRMALAALLGGLIGWERQVQKKPAGLRTLTLVSVSSALYVLAAQQTALRYGEVVDAVRAMAGIAGGIGFLGAGAILQAENKVRWLTSAAALWAAASLGLAAAMGMYYLAVLGCLLVFATLRWLAVAEERWFPSGKGSKNEKGAKEKQEDD